MACGRKQSNSQRLGEGAEIVARFKILRMLEKENNMPEYTQEKFDSQLRKILQEARSKGQRFCRVVSRHLHDRVVEEPQTNRMPMACKSMWKLWEQQGCHKDRIINTTPSRQGSTIEIEFVTDETDGEQWSEEDIPQPLQEQQGETVLDLSALDERRKGHEEYIEIIANESLGVFSKIANTAQSKLDDTPIHKRFDPFAHQNTFTSEKAMEAIRKITEANIRSYSRLTQEPAIARVVAKGEDGKETIYYICRETHVHIEDAQNIRLASYRGHLGRLASLRVGKEHWNDAKGESLLVMENSRFKPQKDAEGWDSIKTLLENRVRNRRRVESLREFLRDKDKVDESNFSRLDKLLEEEKKAMSPFKGVHRDIRKKMELRDQPILDQRQDELFRKPLDSRILLLGAPGTGKTTTLIRRLGQKLSRKFLDANEKKIAGIENEDMVTESNHSESWIMFTPTELLKLYVKEAFNREGIPAPDERISTWDEFRIDLARNRFGILRSASGRGSYVMIKDPDLILKAGAKTDLIGWFTDFDKWQKTVFLEELRGYAKNLSEYSSSKVSQIGKKLLTILGKDGAELQQSTFISLMETTEQIQELDQNIKESSNKRIRGALNLQVNKDDNFLDTFASFIEKLPEEKNDSEEQDTDIDAEEEEEGEPNQYRVGRAGAQTHFMQVVRSQARARARNRNLSKSSKTGRLIEWLGDRTLPDQELKEIGKDLVLQSALRQFINPVRRYINRIPIRYRRFRKERQLENLWYCTEGFSPTGIHPLEVDVILLTMIRETNVLIEDVPELNNPDNPAYKTLEKMQNLYRTQVLVDEVSDFSPIQLSCMMGIAHPRVKSFFACGDFRQRVTDWGTDSIEQAKKMIDGIAIEKVSIPYRQSNRLHDFAEQIIRISDENITSAELPKYEDNEYENNEGVPPVLATHMSEVSETANWLSQRIREIEQSIKELPSIAIFVNNKEEIQVMAAALKEKLTDQHIKVIACGEGHTRGSESAVRIFNIEHIKGLEFEAVFFVGVDILEKNKQYLSGKYLYVGATRAATYLGITCEQDLPPMMEKLRELFGKDWRQ